MTETMKAVVDKVSELNQIRNEIDRLEKQVKDLGKQEKYLSRELIPNLLMEQGISEFKNEDFQVKTVTKYEGTISKSKDQEKAIKILVDNGFGAIIKKSVVVKDNLNDEGKSEVVDKAREALRELGLDFDIKCEVHHQTLKKTIKELLEDTEGVDESMIEDTFGVYQYSYTDVKLKGD